jgi:hypothetical protein
MQLSDQSTQINLNTAKKNGLPRSSIILAFLFLGSLIKLGLAEYACSQLKVAIEKSNSVIDKQTVFTKELVAKNQLLLIECARTEVELQQAQSKIQKAIIRHPDVENL